MAVVINGSGTVTGLAVGGLPDGTVDAGTLADDAVGLAQMASGTDGNLITYDTSGNPAAVAVGTSDQVLTSNGAGAAPTFQDAAGGGKVLGYTFISGSGMTSSGTGTTKVSVCSGSYTPQSGSSKILAIANCQIDARTGYSDNIRWAVFRDSTSFNEDWLIYGEDDGADQIVACGSTFDLGDGHDADTSYTFYLKLGCESSGHTFRVHERSSMLLLELEV